MMNPKWIKVGISVATLLIGAVGGDAIGVSRTKNYRMANETVLSEKVSKLEADLKACRNAPVEAEWITEKGKTKCWTRKVLSGG